MNEAEKYSFYAVKNRAVFHRPGCRFISDKAASELVGLYDYYEGRMMGMTPCNCCNPCGEGMPRAAGTPSPLRKCARGWVSAAERAKWL